MIMAMKPSVTLYETISLSVKQQSASKEDLVACCGFSQAVRPLVSLQQVKQQIDLHFICE